MRYTIAIANGVIAAEEQFEWIHANNRTFRANLGELAKAKYTFAILRDPYLRIGSCYLDKFVNQTPVAWRYHTLTSYRTAPERLTFREFINNLEPHLRGNEHWCPQLDFLVYQDYDDFFCVEDFSKAIEALRARIGLITHDARNLTKHGADQFELVGSDESFADKPAHEIATLKRSGRIPRITQLYDASLVTAVRKIYASDIAFYSDTMKRPCVFSS
jgi:hypothetical protein